MTINSKDILRILNTKLLFDRTYRLHRTRHLENWQYKYVKLNKKKRTDSSVQSVVRTAQDAFSSFLLDKGINSIKVNHISDPDAQEKFVTLARRYDLLGMIHNIIYDIVNYDSTLNHISHDKSKKSVVCNNIQPDQFIFADIDGVRTPIIYTADLTQCWYPVNLIGRLDNKDVKNMKSYVRLFKLGHNASAGLVESDSDFVSFATSHYKINQMSCRAFMAMGVEDEILEYKTSLEALMSMNSLPSLLLDSNAMIDAEEVKPNQIVSYTPNIEAPNLPPLRRTIPDTINLANENIQYIEYLKKQLQAIYMLDVVIKDDTSGSTTAIASLTSDIYSAIDDLVRKFLGIMVKFGYFRDFDTNKNIDSLHITFHSRATQGSSLSQFNNIVQSLETLLKLAQVNQELMSGFDMNKLIDAVTTALGTKDAISFNQ